MVYISLVLFISAPLGHRFFLGKFSWLHQRCLKTPLLLLYTVSDSSDIGPLSGGAASPLSGTPLNKQKLSQRPR
jgi:hypothetical protein